MDVKPRKRLSIASWLATGLGVGLVFPAPGTMGALWGIPLGWSLCHCPSWGGQFTAVTVLFLLGIALCSYASWDLVASGWAKSDKDPQSIVWDELATVPIVYLAAPEFALTGWGLALGFALHRLFDISKPWPCRLLEKLPRGLGIMADDLAAALYGALLFGLVGHYIHG